MKFDKNKNEAKNIQILNKEIKHIASPYSKLLLDALSSPQSPEDFRLIIKEKINDYIETKIKKR